MNFTNYYFVEAEDDDSQEAMFRSDKAPKQYADWRERRVWHYTPTGQRNRVKIKSLPPPEQLKYKPLYLKFKQGEAGEYNPMDATGKITEDPNTLTFYYGVEDPDKFNHFKEGKLVEATLDPQEASILEDDGYTIAEAIGTPMKAVLKFLNEDDEWEKYDEELEDEKKVEKVKFGGAKRFKLDIFPYMKTMRFLLSDDSDQISAVEED